MEFENAKLMKILFDKIIQNQKTRIMLLEDSDVNRNTIIAEDIII